MIVYINSCKRVHFSVYTENLQTQDGNYDSESYALSWVLQTKSHPGISALLNATYFHSLLVYSKTLPTTAHLNVRKVKKTRQKYFSQNAKISVHGFAFKKHLTLSFGQIKKQLNFSSQNLDLYSFVIPEDVNTDVNIWVAKYSLAFVQPWYIYTVSLIEV